MDPTETVLALDKTFGKLARVRLDSVVCVVDAESAAAGGVLGPEAFAEAGGDARAARTPPTGRGRASSPPPTSCS